jgi:isopenicillin N synthase-like dioxygenase
VSIEVPCLDLSLFGAADLHSRRALASELDEACRHVGFFSVVGHGVADNLRTALFAQATAFFDQLLEAKLACAVTGSRDPRGYGRFGGEAQASANGAMTLPDLSESFSWGAEGNVWPALDGFAAVATAYRTACWQAIGVLSRLAALALGMEEEWFLPRVDGSMGTMRMNHYPALDFSPPPTQFRGGSHTDYGFLTLLASDDVPGLEIRDATGAWQSVMPPPGGLLVNIADLLARWTNGRWRSTWHRVVPPSGPLPHPRRLSVVCFSFPNRAAVVAPLPTCTSADDPARFEPVVAGDYLQERLNRLYAVDSPA